jgi:lysophospholipase L1-like esterase
MKGSAERALALESPDLTGIRSFAALGDSFTAGTGSEPGTCWADRLAASLRTQRPDLLYRNLAWEGATSAQVLEQIETAVEIEADLVSLIAGANDVLLTTRPDPERTVENLERGLDSLQSAVPGALILTATIPERWLFVSLGPRTRARVSSGIETVNSHVRRIAAERAIPCLDVAAHPGLSESENFCEDGLHPSPVGHARAASAFGRLLQAHTASNLWVDQP